MSANNFIPESGLRPTRIEFIRETTRGEVPTDPEWNIYSSHHQTWWDWEPDANKNAVQPAGSVDPEFTDAGSETHEAQVGYWQEDWYVDGSGNALDASADAMLVSDDNTVNNTHSVLSRMDVSQNGADGAGYSVFHVGKGGVPTEVTIPFEVDDGSPVQPELSYQFEKFRVYRIDQPSGTALVVRNNSTQSVDVTVENEGATVTDTVTVAAGATEALSGAYDDVDAFELSTDVDGDVELATDDGAGAVDTVLSTIQGSDSYTTEGDLGVPALGSGSHATATTDPDYIIFNDDQYDYDGTPIADEIVSGELNVSLEVEDNEKVATARRNIHITGRRTTWTATVASESGSADFTVDYLTNVVFNNIAWTADEGSVKGPNAELFSPGTSDFEPSNGKHERSLEWQSEGVTIN